MADAVIHLVRKETHFLPPPLLESGNQDQALPSPPLLNSIQALLRDATREKVENLAIHWDSCPDKESPK